MQIRTIEKITIEKDPQKMTIRTRLSEQSNLHEHYHKIFFCFFWFNIKTINVLLTGFD